MKAQLILILTILLFINCDNKTKKDKAEAQKEVVLLEPINNNGGSIKGGFNGCGYNYTPNNKSISIFKPGLRELDQIQSILHFSGLSSNFEIYSSPIENAIATIINGKRYILYDPKLLSYSDENSGHYWSSMSILAHEIGHHLSGHTITNNGSNRSDELQADKFSGFVLYKLGASLEQAIAAMKSLGSESDSYSHPSKYKRIQSITDGWNDAAVQRYESAIPPPPADDNTFTYEGYTKDEFFKEELISPAALQSEAFGGLINSNNYQTLEGIIIDVTNEDPSGGSRTEYFNEPPSNLNFVITVQLTKVPSTDANSNRKVGNREKFHFLNYYQMTHADVGWFEALIVPGRKIRFKSIYFGYGGEDIFYVKKLTRNAESLDEEPQIVTKSSMDNYSVKTDRAYFYSEPDVNQRKKSFLVSGEVLSGLETRNGFIYTEFRNPRGQQTIGWIRLSDLNRIK